MAKKKQADLQVFVPADSKWINTPFAYARLAKELTLLQQQVLLKVSDLLQDYIGKFFASKRNLLPDDPNSLFSPEMLEELPELTLRLDDFGLDKSRYGEIHSAAKVISDIKIKAPNIENGKVNGYKLFPVFSEITVPKADETLEDDAKYNYRIGVMYAHINSRVAAYAFNMRLGYINHPAQIAADAEQVYSPRLYFTIKHYLLKGKKSVQIPYDKLREELGVIVHEMNEDGEYILDDKGKPKVKELYPQYSRFKAHVLEKAKADIDSMGKRNLIDITFSYQENYRSGAVQRGNPESITFFVEQTELGKYHRANPKTRAEMASEGRKRGRPKKQEVDNQPGLFDEIDDLPVVIPNDRVGEWKQLVIDYGDGPSAQLLHNAEYLGTIDGSFALQMPDRQQYEQLSAAAVDDARLKQLLQQAVGRPFKTIQVSHK